VHQTPINTTRDRVPAWRTADEGRRELASLVAAFVAAAADRHDDNPPDTLALRVTAGAGKTAAVLRAVGDNAAELLGRGNVLIYLPTLDLAERADSDFRKIAPGVPSIVVRGRRALRPDAPDVHMCQRQDLVRKVAGIMPSVTEALCRRMGPDGTFQQAPCAAGCRYLAQREFIGGRVVFLTHAYLPAHPPIDPDVPTVLRVIDEKVWSSVARTSRIMLEDFMRPFSATFPCHLRAEHVRARSAVVEALQSNKPVLKYLRDAGIDQDLLSKLADAEKESREIPDIRPTHSEDLIHAKIDLFDLARYRASVTREMVFATLAAAEGESCNRVSFHEEVRGGAARQVIKVHKLTPLPRDAPLLLLDADADPDITKALAHGASFNSIDIKPEAEVVQVEDRTLSNSWLLDPTRGLRRRQQVLSLIEREVARLGGQGVLVVASKAVLAALHRDIGSPLAEDDDAALMMPICGAQPRWFGPRMQGVNDFENFGTVVIVGRLQPTSQDVEDLTRCLFGDDPAELVGLGPEALPEFSTVRYLARGDIKDAKFRSHPDPRASVVLRQLREYQSLQAIARLRLVAPKAQKRVVILSSLPLPDFPVTHLVPFEVACRGLEAEPDPQGYMRLERALCATMGLSVQGTRVSAAGLSEDLPLDFNSLDAAKHFLRGRTTQDVIALVARIAKNNGWPLTPLKLRSAAGGKRAMAESW
jgi:hypothetical protein